MKFLNRKSWWALLIIALYLGVETRSPGAVQELRLQLEEWLGEDWESLLDQSGLSAAATKMKTSLFT